MASSSRGWCRWTAFWSVVQLSDLEPPAGWEWIGVDIAEMEDGMRAVSLRGRRIFTGDKYFHDTIVKAEALDDEGFWKWLAHRANDEWPKIKKSG